MEAATERLRRAVECGERVAIFGDYDVDGACSAALLSEYLTACGCETIVHIPDRVTEGYGPNVEAIADFAAQGRQARRDGRLRSGQPRAVRGWRPRSGSTCRLRPSSGPETLPRTLALVDPNREDDLSGLGHLSAPQASSSWRSSR